MDIVIYSEDIQLISYWEKNISQKVVVVDEIESLFLLDNSLIIIDKTACKNDCKIILNKLTLKNKILVLDRTPNLNLAQIVLNNGASGYANALMHSCFFTSAIEVIEMDMIWLHPQFVSMLIVQTKKKPIDNDILLEELSNREKEVVLLLVDGLIYKDIAEKLNLAPRTVRAHASSIYKKLNVKDRLGLALLFK